MAEETALSTSALVRKLGDNVKKNYQSIVITIAITVLMPLVEEYIVEFNYQCPCNSKTDCANHDSMLTEENVYAAAPLIISTILIFLLGFLAHSSIKCVKGSDGACKNGVKRGDFCFSIVQALILSLAWLALMFIDGDYVACIKTCEAYFNVSCKSVDANLKDLPFSNEYRENKGKSQWIGYVIAFIPMGLFFLINIYEFDSSWFDRACCNCCCFSFDKKLSSNTRKINKDVEKCTEELRKRLPEGMRILTKRMDDEIAQHKARNENNEHPGDGIVLEQRHVVENQF